MSVTLELDQCFLCMEFIGNLTDVHSNSDIEVFFRSIGIQVVVIFFLLIFSHFFASNFSFQISCADPSC